MNPLAQLSGVDDLEVVRRSVVAADGNTFVLVQRDDSRFVLVLGDSSGFEGEDHGPSGGRLCPLTPSTLARLRRRLPWLQPVPLGLRTSFGFGDRLGLATPGHIQSIRHTRGGTDRIAPVFAQQSVRENSRTGRTPRRVMDDAAWAVFEHGWRAPWGADADHLKVPDDVSDFADAGFTFFTIDPGDHVDDDVDRTHLEAKVHDLPWGSLEDSLDDLERRFLSSPFDLEGTAVPFDRASLWGAAAKYGRAVDHTAQMYHHIAATMADRPFELEVSVDETDTPTSVSEHIYIASELRRLGVRWASLAPRFVGRFEKGVDYIGDLEEFSQQFALHAAVARQMGPYKLSLHSGSDKFSIYPIASRLTNRKSRSPGPLVHVKTAGTSFLEALRAVARVDPELFRSVLAVSRARYERDRVTYHVSADLSRVPRPENLDDAGLEDLFEQFDAREVLHVTFGSILDRYGDRIRATLVRNEQAYADVLTSHFTKHLADFAQ